MAEEDYSKRTGLGFDNKRNLDYLVHHRSLMSAKFYMILNIAVIHNTCMTISIFDRFTDILYTVDPAYLEQVGTFEICSR